MFRSGWDGASESKGCAPYRQHILVPENFGVRLRQTRIAPNRGREKDSALCPRAALVIFKGPLHMRTTLVAIATSLTATVAFGQSLNEIRTQQTGIDSQIYAEIAGTSGASLNGLSLLVIGGDDNALPPGQNGYIESVISLDGKAVPASGFFVMAEPSYTLSTPDLVASLGFQTDNNKTFMLVRNFAGIVGDDIDLNDDGTIDSGTVTAMRSYDRLVAAIVAIILVALVLLLVLVALVLLVAPALTRRPVKHQAIVLRLVLLFLVAPALTRRPVKHQAIV